MHEVRKKGYTLGASGRVRELRMIKFRKTQAEDIPMLKEWIANDPPHKHIAPVFFIDHSVSCYAVEDSMGPVMFVRQERSGESAVIHVQFMPMDRKRVALALKQGYPLVAADAKKRGFRYVRFESASPALARFLMKHSKFRMELIAEL